MGGLVLGSLCSRLGPGWKRAISLVLVLGSVGLGVSLWAWVFSVKTAVWKQAVGEGNEGSVPWGDPYPSPYCIHKSEGVQALDSGLPEVTLVTISVAACLQGEGQRHSGETGSELRGRPPGAARVAEAAG